MIVNLVKNGEIVQKIGNYADITDARKGMYKFLNTPSSKGKFKIEEYQTVHKTEEGHTIIDFGDYSYFFEIIP